MTRISIPLSGMVLRRL